MSNFITESLLKPPPRLPLRWAVSYTQIPGIHAGDFFELFSPLLIFFLFSFLGF